jgi:hypothetical protein
MSLSGRKKLGLGLDQQLLGTQALTTVAAPTGGLNTRDNEAAMANTDALVMKNAVPDGAKVISRNGYTSFATGLSGHCETILEYNSSSTRRMIACSDGNVYNATSGGDISASTVGTGFSNARWQGINFRGTLCMVNGADAPQGYDGSTLSNLTISGSGLTPATLKGVAMHKNRLWWWDGVSQDVWYGAVDTIGGSLTKFELGSVAQLGGDLISVRNWSRDGGDGIDDFIVFFMSSGDLLVYQGTDPGSDFALVGIYNVAPPISDRAVLEFGGDIFTVTKTDATFLSDVIKLDKVVTSESKLSGAIRDAATLYSSNFGWEVKYYPKQGWLIINVPQITNSTYVQYIKNSIGGASWQITGWNARTFGIYNDNLYIGGNTEILLADNGQIDGTDGIDFEVQQAYSSFESPLPKTVNYYSPLVKVDGNVTLNGTIFYDFGIKSQAQEINIESTGSPWNTSPWDVTPWSPEATFKDTHYFASGQGTYLGLGIRTSLKGQGIEWANTIYSLTINRG